MAMPLPVASIPPQLEDDITPDDYVPPSVASSSNVPPGIIREGQGEEFDDFIAAGGYGEVYRVTSSFGAVSDNA
jgi:serine/threonine protein kinase